MFETICDVFRLIKDVINDCTPPKPETYESLQKKIAESEKRIEKEQENIKMIKEYQRIKRHNPYLRAREYFHNNYYNQIIPIYVLSEDIQYCEMMIQNQYQLINKYREQEKEVFENEDMKRMKVMIKTTIPNKIANIKAFNEELLKAINNCINQCNNAIQAVYGRFTNSYNYFDDYKNIYKQYSNQISQITAMSCDKTVKNVQSIIERKQNLIANNNQDIEKYQELIQKLQRQYDDDYALQKLKHINKNINAVGDDTSDLTDREMGNTELQSILNDINILDQEVEKRRECEVQFERIEI